MTRSATNLFWQHLRRDAERYERLGGWYANYGFWAVATYRLGKWARTLPKPLEVAVRAPQKLLDNLWCTLFNVRISGDAEIGPGLCLIHPWSVLIGPCSIGENCLIFHEVTLGTNANSDNQFPTIGKNVDIYVGARILGKVTVEDDVKIGANCVVLNSVPKGATVAPPASRVISAAAVAAFGPRAGEGKTGS
jgi:serine O-acetyltransferase